MSAVQKPESTDIQVAERAAIGTLPAAVQQQLELRKLANQVAGKLAELNWGQKLDFNTRRAIADWGQRFNVDVTTEIHVLGGNIYLNAGFYLRKLGELVGAGLVEYAYADHVEADARLTKMGPEGEGEISRRMRERIMHAIPDNALSAVVFRVKLRAMEKEVVGVKWCGGGSRKSDPVGDSFPVETSESRAARRCMRLLTTHVPKRVQDEIIEIEDGAETLSERVEHARREVKAALANEPKPRLMASSSEPYGAVDTPAEQPKQPPVTVVEPRTAAERQAAEARAAMPDPYDDDEIRGESPAVEYPIRERQFTPSPAKKPTISEASVSINKLIKHPSVTAEQRKAFTERAANARSIDDLIEIIGEVETIISGDQGA